MNWLTNARNGDLRANTKTSSYHIHQAGNNVYALKQSKGGRYTAIGTFKGDTAITDAKRVVDRWDEL